MEGANGSENDHDTKLLQLISTFPEEIITTIFSHLPSAYISQFFLHVNPFYRQLVIENYYSNELHVVLSPTRRQHHCVLGSPLVRELIDFNSFVEIDDFLSENPDINPKTLVIITGGDFRSFETLLVKYQERFLNQISALHFHIERYDPTSSDLQLISSFSSNLTKLQFTGSDLKVLLKPSNQSFLAGLKHLKQLVLLGHKINNWSKIAHLPPFLQHIDISWNEESNISQLELPSTITDIYWNQSGIDNEKLRAKSFPANLKTLMLTYNNISDVNLGSLPPTLETLDLSYNCITSFNNELDGAVSGTGNWPPQLKSILLSHNLINDETLKQLSKYEWPTNLQNLKLDNNPFTTLNDLVLPDSIDYLDLSQTRLTSLNMFSEMERLQESGQFNSAGHYPYFKFPIYLETLNLSNSECLILPENDVRIKFPSRLMNLNLDECGIQSLECFQFPESLHILSLCGNKIQDLNSYENISNKRDDVFSWQDLKGLSHLELYFNNIVSLESWLPPNNLKYIDLGKNSITALTAHNTPIFQYPNNKSLKLASLRLGINTISNIDIELHLPPHLQKISLHDNSLQGKLIIPASFTMERLDTLDLSDNSIESISFAEPGVEKAEENSRSLKNLDLTRNLILKQGKNAETIKKFYDELELGLDLKVTKRKANVNSLHTFIETA